MLSISALLPLKIVKVITLKKKSRKLETRSLKITRKIPYKCPIKFNFDRLPDDFA
jgi:hypothetical protein